MKIDERHLVQLAAVVKAGGVVEGAAMLGLTQPAVSRTLALLEKRVGEPLFDRGRRPLQPTPLGRELAQHGMAVIAASRKATETIDSFRLGRSGVVRVGGTPYFMDGLIAGMAADFQTIHADVRIEQSYGYISDLKQGLTLGQIDLAICPIDLLDEGSGLVAQEILPGRNVIACRLTHPLLMSRKLRPASLLEYPWIAPPPTSPLLADLHSLLLSLGATEAKIRYSGGSLMNVVNYLKGSDALTVLPHSTVFSMRNDRSITALPLPIPHPERALVLLRQKDAPGMPAVENFARHIARRFKELKHLIERHEQAIVWGG
ncbi:LysR family transcriptional regulator [Allorhizobium sp. BGMRC 0089]|uniref:LysR family transcriptional regulator n=1 Tax=Allorhizobium sonneratiae TaxID=2934936 RepID=UPI0020346FAF|nr:LysR family transcriptional regulator [Allorhizobium sonneratiae]MCM2293813.1 LysR family transcriptional regulator [Allorhizobium sonneratiae]